MKEAQEAGRKVEGIMEGEMKQAGPRCILRLSFDGSICSVSGRTGPLLARVLVVY